jgi:hypothetical protein
VATELGGNQITSLMETLPGIANVLRSPVADAIVNSLRAAVRLREFQVGDADELIKYAVRRNLLGSDEGDRVLAEVKAADQKRQERVAERQKAQANPAKKQEKAPPKPKAKVKVAAPVARQVKAVKPAKKTAKPARKR